MIGQEASEVRDAERLGKAVCGNKRTVKKQQRPLPSLLSLLARSGGLVSDEKSRAPKPCGGGAR